MTSICKFFAFFVMISLRLAVAVRPSDCELDVEMVLERRIFGMTGWIIHPSARSIDVIRYVAPRLRSTLPSTSGTLPILRVVEGYHQRYQQLMPTLPGTSIPELLSSLPGFVVQPTQLGDEVTWCPIDEISRYNQTWHPHHPDGFTDSSSASSSSGDEAELCDVHFPSGVSSASTSSLTFEPHRNIHQTSAWSPYPSRETLFRSIPSSRIASPPPSPVSTSDSTVLASPISLWNSSSSAVSYPSSPVLLPVFSPQSSPSLISPSSRPIR